MCAISLFSGRVSASVFISPVFPPEGDHRIIGFLCSVENAKVVWLLFFLRTSFISVNTMFGECGVGLVCWCGVLNPSGCMVVLSLWDAGDDVSLRWKAREVRRVWQMAPSYFDLET